MAEVIQPADWHGTPEEALEWNLILTRNHADEKPEDVIVLDEFGNTYVVPCPLHKWGNTEQRVVDGMLYARRLLDFWLFGADGNGGEWMGEARPELIYKDEQDTEGEQQAA